MLFYRGWGAISWLHLYPYCGNLKSTFYQVALQPGRQ